MRYELRCQGIRLDWGCVRLRAGMDLTLKSGEIVYIQGPNGSGKSSLLSLLWGNLMPVSGNVYWNQVSVASKSFHQKGRCPWVVMTQRGVYPSEWKAMDYLFVGLSSARSTQQGHPYAHPQVQYWVNRYQLSPLLTQSLGQLSGGEKQRLRAVRTLIKTLEHPAPGYVLLDEWGAALDATWQAQLMQEWIQLAEAGWLVVMASPHPLDSRDVELQWSDANVRWQWVHLE